MTPDKILLEICKEEGYKIASFCDNYVQKLEKNGQNRYIIGRHLGLNSDVSATLADDKSATFTILNAKNIPAIPHHLYKNPKLFPNYKNPAINSQTFPLVIKPNSGTHGGTDVVLAKTPAEATAYIKKLFKKYNSLALSPFVSATHEYRCFVLNHKAYLVYEKTHGKDDSLHFNLSRGATARLVKSKSKLYQPLESLSVRTADALGLRCATIDILSEKVLEAHSAPANLHLTEQLPEAKPLLKRFYRDALKSL